MPSGNYYIVLPVFLPIGLERGLAVQGHQMSPNKISDYEFGLCSGYFAKFVQMYYA